MFKIILISSLLLLLSGCGFEGKYSDEEFNSRLSSEFKEQFDKLHINSIYSDSHNSIGSRAGTIYSLTRMSDYNEDNVRSKTLGFVCYINNNVDHQLNFYLENESDHLSIQLYKKDIEKFGRIMIFNSLKNCVEGVINERNLVFNNLNEVLPSVEGNSYE